MMHVKIYTPTWYHFEFSVEENESGLRYATDLIDETQHVTHIEELAIKKRSTKIYNLKEVPREMQDSDLILI